ncbi:desulfoferrodoxin [Clostridium cylindrosporum]|uniref:Desulfoferrodoxin n=1 Tax=Clostridium cylindrosporum DSM 605 TaxID=1121307 RepID=A0A0J8DAI6_CLOCY|nr:desulfoferrodoxin [Clostridium cylindrosporum]KMT21318.1 desulfoferrodoxin Dfx [Clostridium cylindrosporum DSM 605]
MSKLNELYKCELCGNIVQVVKSGAGTLVCCGKPMNLQEENTVDASTEKHVPVIERVDGGILVKIGSVEHPMEDKHFIEWIEVYTNDRVYRKYLNPSDKPEALFNIDSNDVVAKAYCNIHGYWKSN